MREYKPLRREFKSRNKMTQKELLKDDIYNSDPLIEKILNSKKIKYKVLDELFKSDFPDNISTITMYIDINSVLNQLYNPKVMESLSEYDNTSKYYISANIINMAGHFRKYFASRKSKFTNFIFYYSFNKSQKEIDIYPNYKESYYFKHIGKTSEYIRMNKLLKENLKICQIISDYLPHIYFINTKEINPLVVPYYFLQYQEKNEYSIIYSNDKLSMMNCLNNKKCMILSNSYGNIKLRNELDFLEWYYNKEVDTDINPSLIPYMYSISGYKKYDINGLPKYAEIKTLKLFEKLIKENIINNIKYSDTDTFISDISNYSKFTQDDIDIISRNCKLFNLDYIVNNLSVLEKTKIEDSINDLQDINELNKINDTYYEKYPIILEDLLIGEEYESVY